MAGAFPARMAVKKNKFIEEWNGKREITNLDFELDAAGLSTFFVFVVFIPYGMYTWSRAELLGRGDRRYQKLV